MLNDAHASKREKPESCLTCRFFFPTPKCHDTNKGSGDCRRFPPNGTTAGHPTTHAVGWCGEYKHDDHKVAHVKALDDAERKRLEDEKAKSKQQEK